MPLATVTESMNAWTVVEPEDIERLIQNAIRDHEIRVAAVSGVMGTFLLVGTWHAIWLLR